MFKKAWLLDSLDAIAEQIGGINVGLHFNHLPPQYSQFIDQITGEKWLIDNNISQTPEPPVTLMYLPIGGQLMESISTNFVGTIPHKPK